MMTTLRRAASAALTAARQPAANSTRDQRAPERNARATITFAPATALDALARRALVGLSAALLLPAASVAPLDAAGSFARAVTRSIAPYAHVTIGTRERAAEWRRAVMELGLPVAQLGDAGWERVNLTDHGLLDAVFLPVEVASAQRLVALPDPRRARALGLWLDVAHPHSALRARLGGDRAVADLAVAGPSAAWLFPSGPPRAPIAVLSDDPVAAELAQLAGDYLRDDASGYEQRGPWEDTRVQATIERGVGVAAGHDLRLVVSGADAVTIEYAEAVARLLGCALERQSEG